MSQQRISDEHFADQLINLIADYEGLGAQEAQKIKRDILKMLKEFRP